MSKKIKKILSWSVVAIIFMIAVIFCIATARWNHDVQNSSYGKAINNPDKLLIVYRPNCRRCHRTLPRLFLEHCIDSRGEYLLNANKLSKEQLDKLDCRITPAFRYQNVSYNTDNYNELSKVWARSH